VFVEPVCSHPAAEATTSTNAPPTAAAISVSAAAELERMGGHCSRAAGEPENAPGRPFSRFTSCRNLPSPFETRGLRDTCAETSFGEGVRLEPPWPMLQKGAQVRRHPPWGLNSAVDGLSLFCDHVWRRGSPAGTRP